ncbi:alpha-galactosidase [Bifidobacterium sp. SMB2]|uniref:alpha-galactosidase n=1 Tax=Bifidobacterium saimiriisciurei TaxID=2661627 RepID=A0ABX0CB89_9BIFI|nr:MULTISPECIES: alpha-galactosidase [Bifidobacterium]NEG95643.1 alpha-galactosidase [Bifidobacterium sp. SMB2]NEH11956.1 alpha-galactosidase [Bifidobacterium saimiriisciurei]
MPQFTPNPARPIVERYDGTSSDGTRAHVIYMEQTAANVAFALVFPDRRHDDAGRDDAGNISGGSIGEAGDSAESMEPPRIVHWGRPLPGVGRKAVLLGAYDALKPQRVSGALSETSWPSILPTQAESWLGKPRIVVRRDGVELFCRFAVTDLSATADGDTAAVNVTMQDVEQGVQVVWRAELEPSGLVRQRAEVRNLSDEDGVCEHEAGGRDTAGRDTAGCAAVSRRAPLEVGGVELGFPIPETASEILTTTGHHLRERSPQRQPFTIGRFEKNSLAGRPDFDASLLLTAGTPGFGFEHGEAYAVHVGWSGNSTLAAERLPYTTGVIGGGELLSGGEVTLTANPDGTNPDTYTTPWVYGSYGDGLNEIAARFHHHLRSLHPNLSAKPRPVILNTWEAVYFGQNYDTLAALADKAAEIGVERFVVDDGWFGSRRDDTSGLGDWHIAKSVWPDGEKSLKALADHVHGLGMEFGLWFEPEMVNPNSDVAREHPDWILAPTPNRLPMEGRSQQVLDLTNPAAFDYILGSIDTLIDELGIDYIKWDHNKLVTEAASPVHGHRPAVHAQTLAVYDIWRTLKERHPGLEIESCSSGGGRVDLGILEYADRIWASDCVDPVERADIQRYTSLLVPPEMIGAHVGASPAHSTGRATTQTMRMAMAFLGHLGVEWNLLDQPQQDLDLLAEWIAEFKKHREWFAIDTMVHADSADPAVRLDGVVKPDRSAAIYRFAQLTTSATYPVAPMHVPGLDPAKNYLLQPVPVNVDISAISNGQTPLGWWNADGITLSGAQLSSYGLRMPSLDPANAVLFWAIEV